MLHTKDLESLIGQAMKAKDKLTLEVYRALKTRIANEKIAKGELTEDAILALIRSEIKRRKEAGESYSAAGRTEQAQKELDESKILEHFLPTQMSDEELEEKVKAVINSLSDTEKNFGQIMGQLKKELGTSVDGARLSAVVKAALG